MNLDFERLENIVGKENLRKDPGDLYIYGSDASVHTADASVILRPRTGEQIQEIVRYASEKKISVIPRGSGSGMSGHAVPVSGGIVLDLKKMDRIIEIKPADGYCRVEPGVIDDDLNRALKPYGFFYPPTPASSKIATIGGEIANNASGVRSVKYGATRDAVLGMKVVLASGELVTLGTNTRVDAAGYQLCRLMVGSEGTLGTIVEATLKLTPLPKLRALAVMNFDRLEDAGKAIAGIIESGATPSMLELMDNIAIGAVNKTLGLKLPDVEAILMFEADGNVREAIDYEINLASGICKKNGGYGLRMSYDAKEREKLYAGRKKLFTALSRYREGYVCTSLADDMAVPYSKMAECACKLQEIGKRNNIIMTAYGHCGSGVMHTKILMDVSKRQQWEDARRAVDETYEYIRSVGGTTSGEHGIAISKAPAWKKEKADSLGLMRAVKKAFDPNNIMNPGKMMDAPDDWVTATRLRYRSS